MICELPSEFICIFVLTISFLNSLMNAYLGARSRVWLIRFCGLIPIPAVHLIIAFCQQQHILTEAIKLKLFLHKIINIKIDL